MTDELHNHCGWKIYRGRWPEPAWLAIHPDYDASYDGPDDGWQDNGLKATAATYEELCDEVEAVIAEHPHFAQAIETRRAETGTGSVHEEMP